VNEKCVRREGGGAIHHKKLGLFVFVFFLTGLVCWVVNLIRLTFYLIMIVCVIAVMVMAAVYIFYNVL
jgi:hypothetical protein